MSINFMYFANPTIRPFFDFLPRQNTIEKTNNHIPVRDLSRLNAVPNIGPFPKANGTEKSQFVGYKFPNWLIYICFNYVCSDK